MSRYDHVWEMMDTRVFFDIYTGVRPQVFFDMHTSVQPPPPCIHHPPNAHHSSRTSSGVAFDRESDHVFSTNCGDIVDNLPPSCHQIVPNSRHQIIQFRPPNHPNLTTKSSKSRHQIIQLESRTPNRPSPTPSRPIRTPQLQTSRQ